MAKIPALALALMTAVIVRGAQRETTLASNPAPSGRQLGAFYFDALNESQVWVNLQPAAPNGAPGAITINFTIRFPGHRLTMPPAAVTIRAQPVCATFFGIPRAELRFTVGGTTTIDLTGADARFQFVGGCLERGQGSDTLVVDVPTATLLTLAAASQVDVDALGFPLRFGDEDMAALRRFVSVVSGGVTVP